MTTKEKKRNFFFPPTSNTTEISNSEEAAEMEAVQQLASIPMNKRVRIDQGPITLFHLLDALQVKNPL